MDARSTPRRKKVRKAQTRKPQAGINQEDVRARVQKLLEKVKGLATLCTPQSCGETVHVVKERIEGRFCMDAIDSERLHSSRSSSAATPRVQTSQRTKAGGLSSHIFGFPSLDQDYLRDPSAEATGFGDKLERYIHVKTQTERAVLTIPKSGIPSEMQPGEIERQLQSLCRVDHPSIVQFREACEDEGNLKLVYDWVDGGPLLCNLELLIDPIKEVHLAEFAREILSALAAANSFGVHHLDLCLSTIFVVTAGSFCPVKVLGLGLAGYLTALVSCKEVSKSNKHYYAAPEVFYTHNVKRLSPAARHASDVWSVGAILYTLCSGRPPFGAGSIQELSGKVQRAMWSFGVEFAECSYVLKEAIEEMLKVPWRSRPSATACLHLSFLESKESKPSRTTMEQLKAFLGHDHCSQTVARMLIDTGLSKKAYTKMETMFKELDRNGDGSVSQAELQDSASALGIEEEMVSSVIKILDRNGNGQLDISEFLAAVVMEQEATDERTVKAVFNKIDRDADWRLTKREMFTTLRQYTRSLEPGDVSSFVQHVDQDGDHKVDLEEFAKIFPAVSRAEEGQDRIRSFTAFLKSYESMTGFRKSVEAWARKLSLFEEKLLCACGLRERDAGRGLLSYEKNELSEYEVHLLFTSVAELLEQVPGNPAKHGHHKKVEDSGTNLTGIAMLAARCEALQAGGKKEGGNSQTALDEFTRTVQAHRHEMGDTKPALAMSLYWLLKVKSQSAWLQPLRDALRAMRQTCTSHYVEVVLRSRLDFSRCHSNLTDEYSLREATVLPREDQSAAALPQGAKLLPVHALKGAEFTSTVALRGLTDKALPLKLVFRWDRDEGKADEQRQVHLSKLAWASRYVKLITEDVHSLLGEVDEDMQACASTEGRLPGLPAASPPYLKHCEGRGLPEDALTPREEVEDTGELAPEELTASAGSLSEAVAKEPIIGRKRIERTQVLADQVRRQRLAESIRDV